MTTLLEELDEKGDDKEEGRARMMDPELKTISAILRLLRDLDDKACDRVVTYISSRFTNQGET